MSIRRLLGRAFHSAKSLGPNDPRFQRDVQARISSDDIAGPLQIDADGRLTVLVDAPLESQSPIRLRFGTGLMLEQRTLIADMGVLASRAEVQALRTAAAVAPAPVAGSTDDLGVLLWTGAWRG